MESDVIYHFLLEVFRSLYVKTVTPQWHYGDGSDRPPTNVHMSIVGFRQGDAPVSIFFNILAAIIYRKQLATLNGRGVLFAIVDDAKIAAHERSSQRLWIQLRELRCKRRVSPRK